MNRPITKAGRYQIVSELGRGAMGVVYEGFDPVIGRAVAIKTMLTEGLSGSEYETYRARFQREAQAAGVLAHPNIVTIYDFGEDEGFLFLAMELLKGKSVEKLLQEQTVLPIETIIPIYQQVCSALDFAHLNKIVHRDIKPANIMILENGQVKVADFGIAKMLTTGMTRAGQILGTPNYMSPEQVKGRGVDGRSDIFALGVILYELVTGEKPFAGQNVTTVIYKIMHENPISPRELEPTIHPGLSAVITRALAKSMDERYQTCGELAEDLKNYRNLGGPSPSSTASIQRPMLEISTNETAALDVSTLRGVTEAPAAGPVPPSPAAHAPQAPPAPRVEAAPRVAPPPVQAQAAPRIQAPSAAPPRPVAAQVAPPAPVAPKPEPQASALLEARPEAPAPAPSPAPVVTPAPQSVTVRPAAVPPAAVQAKRTSSLVWVGAAALLVIAAAGGYFLPHRGPVASTSQPRQAGTNAPSVSSPAANSSQTAPPQTTASETGAATAAPQGTEQASQAGTLKNSQASPASANQPAGNPPAAAGELASKPRREHAAAAAGASQAPKIEASRTRATAAGAGTGQVSVTANVDGAKISIDGKGDADWLVPHTFTLPAGTHQIAVLKEGYVTWGKSITVEAGGSQSVGAQLAPPTGEVDFITDPPGLEVFIDGKSVGVTPLQSMVSVGEHPYKIIPPPGLRAAEGTVTAKETSIAKKTISFR